MPGLTMIYVLFPYFTTNLPLKKQRYYPRNTPI